MLPDITALLEAGKTQEAWDAGLALEADAPAELRLRRQRSAVALTAAIADLAGAWDLNRVTRSLSDFADHAINEALAAAYAERYPDEPVRGIAVIALGKHGSRELNYSSDIDPILIFDPDTVPRRAREEPQEAALRLAQKMVAILSARTGDGYVFRVDLRLRPNSEVTPIILPVDATIGYYESAALGWEQAAFIRARAAAGDAALGENFLSAIRPFVWRRSLDFGAVQAISDVSRRIRAHYASGQRFGPGYDLKRGRGGIREVEFFAQAHQLIHGGRNPALRPPATRDALAALTAQGLIDPETAGRLDAAYVALREAEHRLQMVDDRQTHSIPANAEALEKVARLAGAADGDAFIGMLLPHVEAVGAQFDRLLGVAEDGDETQLPQGSEQLEAHLAQLGIEDPEPFMARIRKWRGGDLRALRSVPAREALEELLPTLIPAIARAPAPIAALNRLDDVLSGLPSAINFLRLLIARPGLAETLVLILSHAPTLAEALGRRPALFDGLIDTSALDPAPDVPALMAEMRGGDGEDFQARLDHVRHAVSERRFALGVQIIRGNADPLDVGRGYGRVADAAVNVLTQAAIEEFEAAHGKVPGGDLAIIAMGRYGGGLLTHASDLDLVFLFTGDFATESDGRRPLGATQYFNRLSQRVVNALSVPTAAGALYEVDTRLRPSGTQGLLAVSVESFARYQSEAAWTWEHLALTRARPVFGSAQAREQIAQVVRETLEAPRDGSALLAAAAQMRADIARHKPPKSELDVKLVPGGLVDLEFLVHVTQLTHRTAFLPDLASAIEALTGQGLLPPAIAPAHALLTRYLIVSRLVTPDSAEPPEESRWLVAKSCGTEDWADLLTRAADARRTIGDAWNAMIAQVPAQET
jgi:glutamate-ammonia-ligase adenylyltransferase